MGFKLKSSKNDPMSEINVTPFVDVMLVLLIIFMVTAPLLTVGVQVDLPETSADTLPEENEPLTLTINSKGEIFIQETKVEFNNLIVKILAVSNNRTDTRIYVRGDKAINYGRVLEIMGMLSGSGFTKVALISEPNRDKDYVSRSFNLIWISCRYCHDEYFGFAICCQKNLDIPPLISVELIQIAEKTNIPFAPKASKIIEKAKKENEKLLSEQAPKKK